MPSNDAIQVQSTAGMDADADTTLSTSDMLGIGTKSVENLAPTWYLRPTGITDKMFEAIGISKEELEPESIDMPSIFLLGMEDKCSRTSLTRRCVA